MNVKENRILPVDITIILNEEKKYHLGLLLTNILWCLQILFQILSIFL